MGGRLVGLLALLLAPFVFPFGLAAQARPVYTVSTVGELLDRLGPDRTIILQKGDYSLPSVYGRSGPGFDWLQGEDGAELMVIGADNLALRGMDGARILTDSLKSYLIGFYKSSKITIDNISFLRDAGEGTVPEAGLLYAESVADLSLSRAALGGPSGLPLELWDCGKVSLEDVALSGGRDGAMGIGKVGDLSVTGGSVREIAGFPLIYAEQSGPILFQGTEFADNSGGNFFENWPAEDGGETASVRFVRCSFIDEDFDNFVGNSNLPETIDCQWKSSSFDESWALDSVDRSSDQSYGSYDASTETHIDDASGLSFDYPGEWEFQDGPVQGQALVYGADDDSIVFFAKSLDLSQRFDRSRDSSTLMAKGFASFKELLSSQAGLNFDASQTLPLADWEDWQLAEYGGNLSAADGSSAPARLRLVLEDGGVWGLLVLSSDDSKLTEGGELDGVLRSLTSGGMGD
ncbi:MAG TPA: hypothetical protein VMV83_10415 [Rectinemataceae bacterium]|nr:hypothetical protein [Rectinemataceae bacterium]